MANTVITIEIATLIHAALKAVVPADTYVYARGVITDDEGTADDSATAIKRKCPMVDIIPSERSPQGHASVLRSYPVKIRVITYGPNDQWQKDLYTISDSVSDWLCSAPNLAMTLAEFDALVIDGPPEVGNAGENDALQYQEWNITIKTRAA